MAGEKAGIIVKIGGGAIIVHVISLMSTCPSVFSIRSALVVVYWRDNPRIIQTKENPKCHLPRA